MQDAPRVCGTERVGDLCPDVDDAPIAECPVVLEQRAKAHALDEFGDEVARAVLLARIVDDDDSRVIEGRDDRCFAMKTLDSVRVRRDLGVDDFDRDVTSQTRIAGAIHRAHSALSDSLQDVIVGDRGARLQFR